MKRATVRRRVDGLLLLDKPSGLTSNAALQQVKRLFNAHKAGHTGALDPLASGMLPICLGQATKFSQFLLDADKSYYVTAKLGVRTDTSDAQGKVIDTRPVDVTPAILERALVQFRGEITQVPSCYSALKYQGKPRYHYARLGIEVPRKSRQVALHQLRLIAFDGLHVTLAIECSKGTYIRTVVDDLGELLGCGAHVTALRRLKVAQHFTADMVTLEQLQALASTPYSQGGTSLAVLDSLLLPMDQLVCQLPEIVLGITAAHQLQQGKAVPLSEPAPSEEWVRLTVKATQQFIGIGRCLAGQLFPKRLLTQLPPAT